MEITPQLQYGALGVLAIFMYFVLKFAAKYIEGSSKFIRDLTTKSMNSMEELGTRYAKAQDVSSEALLTLNKEVTKTQKGMREALEAFQVSLLESESERQREHEQLMTDHQAIMSKLCVIEEQTSASTSHNT